MTRTGLFVCYFIDSSFVTEVCVRTDRSGVRNLLCHSEEFLELWPYLSYFIGSPSFQLSSIHFISSVDLFPIYCSCPPFWEAFQTVFS